MRGGISLGGFAGAHYAPGGEAREEGNRRMRKSGSRYLLERF
jgi:hypothetical protein